MECREFISACNTYYEDVLTHAMFRSLNKQDAEDITQDSFIKTFLSKETIETNGNVKSCLYRAVTFCASDYYRKIKGKGSQSKFFVNINFLNKMEDRTLEHIDVKEACMSIFNAVLLTLTPRLKQVAMLYYINDYNSTEISNILDTSQKTVVVQLSKIKKKLRAYGKKELIYN